jgi:hypothetical protein
MELLIQSFGIVQEIDFSMTVAPRADGVAGMLALG